MKEVIGLAKERKMNLMIFNTRERVEEKLVTESGEKLHIFSIRMRGRWISLDVFSLKVTR